MSFIQPGEVQLKWVVLYCSIAAGAGALISLGLVWIIGAFV